jgi:hypothetical protein
VEKEPAKALPGKRAEIEVASLDLGEQIVAEWSRWSGLPPAG